jgi:hypothetical protein
MNEPYMYVVLIGLCILVFSSILPKSRGDKEQESSPQMVKEMEETMEGFLAELEEDNQKLLDTITSMKKEHNQSISKLTDRLEGMEKQFQEERQDWRRLALERVERQEKAVIAEPVTVPSEPARPSELPVTLQEEEVLEQPAPSIRSRYEELFRMHDEGKSIEYIARKKGLNKGEVSLIFQLALQEEQKGVEK